MNKTDLLFQMMEQPQAYTEQQWQEILSNDECRELYTLMAKTQNAFDIQKDVTDEEIDAEWQRFEHKCMPYQQRFNWMKITASFIGILLITGMAFAAVHIVRNHRSTARGDMKSPTQETRISNSHQLALPTDTTATIPPVVFDNVTLDSILPQIARYYDYTVSFRSDKSKPLRLFLTWNPQDSIQKVTDKLNLFEQIHIVLEEQTMIVE